MSSTAYRFADFTLLPLQRQLSRAGAAIALGARAMDLLVLLVQRHGEVVAKEALIAAVWPGTVVEENNLRVQLAAVRKALGESSSGPRFIVNVPLRGYSFVAEVVAELPGDLAPGLRAAVGAAVPRRPALPVAPTRLVGRAAVVANLCAQLVERRLVTLTGPGGVGKTSVAVAVAGAMPPWPDGTAFVDLAAVTEPARVPVALAVALGVPVQAGSASASVHGWLAQRRMLVVLDNCEHVVDAAAAEAEALLRCAPGVTLLATSREPLRIAGEWIHRLAALGVPAGEPPPSLAQACLSPACELFVERARASQDGIRFGDADAPGIVELCRRLDGLPLAIELMAARIETFGLAGLLARYDDRLRLLGHGRRTALPRHQTLRATLDWSYDTLAPSEQRLLRHLSVFRGRFDGAAAAAVACDGCSLAEAEDALEGLVSRSLLAVHALDADAPYRLLETTRAYAADKLAADGVERHAAMARHALWCRQALEAAEPELQHLAPADWHARHARRIDDVRAALEWALHGGDAALGVRLAGGAVSLWLHLGLVHEATQQLQAALAHLPTVAAEPAIAAQVLVACAHCVAIHDGPSPAVDAMLDQGQNLLGSDGAAPLKPVLLLHWTRFISDIVRGTYASALEHSAQFATAATQAADDDAVYAGHRMQALALHFLGRQCEARTRIDQALAPGSGQARGVLRGSPQQSDHATAALVHRARILWLQGFADQARAAARTACEQALDRRHTRPLVYALSYAACPIALWSGDHATAARYNTLLDESTERFGLPFWREWPQLYAHALQRHDPAQPPPPALPDGTLNAAHAHMLSTLDVDYLPPGPLPTAEAARAVWCGPEVLRMAALAAARRHGPAHADVEPLLQQAIAVAQNQGAHAWALRAATSLARVLLARERRVQARDTLARQLEQVSEGLDTADVLAAQQVLAGCG